MEEEVVDHKDTVVHEVEVPTTEQETMLHEVEIPTTDKVEQAVNEAPHEQPDIVQGVPTHTIADIPMTQAMETVETSPNSNVKYLFCKFCPYKTRFVGNLTKHVRTHTGEKPFACRHCGKRFASRSNLNYHEATHTGNKRFQCFISGCQFKTQLRESLNSHMRKIHGVLVSADSPLPPGADTLATGSSGVAGAPGLPMFSPSAVGSLPNLPPIQDILTAPTSLSSMTLPQNSQVNLNDVKPSVAELAQYMIALHEGTTPQFTKSDCRPSPRSSLSSSSAPHPLGPPELQQKPDGAPFGETSPEMATVETDNDSGAGSPRAAAIMAASSAGIRLSTDGSMVAKAGWDPQMMTPRLPPPTMHAAVKHTPHTPILTNLVDPKSSSLSNELLKIFSNLGLDTPAILDLLAAQGKLHICRSCNIVFPEYSTFVLHRGCHGNEGPFQCHFCQQRFPEKFGFLTHFMQCPHK